MRHSRRRSFAVALVVATLASFVAAPPAAAKSRSTQQRLQETRRQLRAARSRLAALRATDAQLMATIRGVQRQLNGAKGLLYEAQSTLAEIDARIKSHERTLTKLQTQRTERDKAMDRRIASLYMLGPAVEADALMTAGDFQEFVDRSNAFDFIVRSDKLNMEELSRLSDKTSKARSALRKEAERAQVWRKRVSERVSLVWDALSTHRAAERTLNARMQEYLKEVRELEAEQNRISSLINARGSYSVGAVSLKGFQWPVRGRRITSPYGRRWGGTHTGMDIDCETGDPTFAAKAGRVIAAEWGGGYGNMVIVDHGNGVSSLYAHHSRLYVSDGARVARGQRIGACGSTGHSTGSHLHFEIRVNGKPRNPRPYLP